MPDMSDRKICGLDPLKLIEHAVRNARLHDVRKAPRWVAVMDAFAVGSTSGHDLCRHFGLDPDEEVKRPAFHK